MTVTPGSRIGPYQVSEQIGAGGMGEVFRAVDVNLGRAAALKVLPASLATDPDRLARFEREAQTLASLNHPNIAQVFGFEKGEGSFRALAMEFVEGPTLADRIGGVPMPIDDVIPIAVQIADALESAHDHGIIHRDLKPLNIKVRPDGMVKVLDFGLAKAIAPSSDSSAGLSAHSPTITTPAMTHAGVILGTASYMSPEQAKGRVVDRRTDIWAFGCVLFEMLTGKRAFSGDDVSDVVVAILRDEPKWAALPTMTPPHVRSLLRRCLQKDPRKRLPHIGVARLELAEPALVPVETPPPAPRQRLMWRLAAAAVIAAAVGLPSWMLWSRRTPTPATPVRLLVDLGPYTLVGSPALSPDGQTLAFVGRPITETLGASLYVRSFQRLDAELLDGTAGAQQPFFSPDGRWIAFFADGMLKKVSTQGGAVITICEALGQRQGSWVDEDVIVFATSAGLSRVPAAGGTAVVFASVTSGEPPPFSPQVLPRRRGVLYSAAVSADPSAGMIFVRDLDGGAAKELVDGGRSPRYVESGHLTFVRRGTLFAVPFDLDALEVKGEPVPVVEGVFQLQFNAAAAVAISASGTLAYQPGAVSALRQAPVMWLKQAGPLTTLRAAPSAFAFPRFSPDGRRLALSISDGRLTDIWVYDWERDIMTRVTTDPVSDLAAVWTPDGSVLIYGSTRPPAATNLYWQRADGTGVPQRLTTGSLPQVPNTIDPEGRRLVYHEGDPSTGRQSLAMVTLERDGEQIKAGEPTTLVGGPFLKANARISPDGKWMAYAANNTGGFEIYVQPFPGPGERVQVSNGGGNLALWSRTKQELYYAGTGQGRLMMVPYEARNGAFVPAKPRPWSEEAFSTAPPFALYGPGFDMHPDGTRFAVAPPMQAAESRGALVLVFNFLDELRRLVPVK